MSNFWDKVLECEHKNIYPDYYEDIYCSTPYCSGYEIHCKDCGAFISECGCLSNSGISGWSNERWKNFEKKKYGRKLETHFIGV